jgi:hypothetical protein
MIIVKREVSHILILELILNILTLHKLWAYIQLIHNLIRVNRSKNGHNLPNTAFTEGCIN